MGEAQESPSSQLLRKGSGGMDDALNTAWSLTWWYRSVILATREAKAEGSQVQGLHVTEGNSGKFNESLFQNKKLKEVW